MADRTIREFAEAGLLGSDQFADVSGLSLLGHSALATAFS
jgi:hypothetical protein